jgi:DNA-directed RNA polymerase specialized sigma24 family protein
MRPLVTSIADGLYDAESRTQAIMAVYSAIRAFDAEALDEAVFATNVVAELAGNLMVREGEKGAPKRLELAPPRGETPDDEEPEDPFVDKPWQDAVDAFRKRGNVTPEDLARLLRDVQARSREQRDALLVHVQERTYELLAEEIGEGSGTYKTFAAKLRADMAPIGVTAEDDGYLQMVFRTNVQGAYSAGRDKASKDPEILELRPYALYLTAGDGFVRSEHAEYAEKNQGVYRIGSPEWEAVRPPPKGSPFNCRCSWVTLTREEAIERGAEV